MLSIAAAGGRGPGQRRVAAPVDGPPFPERADRPDRWQAGGPPPAAAPWHGAI